MKVFELAVSKPRVVYREINGENCEPYEMLTVDVEDGHQGAVMEELGRRRGDLQDMQSDGKGRVRLEYRIPARAPDWLPGGVSDHDARLRLDLPCVRRLRSD